MNDSAATLAGRTVLITGAARRIGAAIARMLHGQGANIIVHYRNSSGPATELQTALTSVRSESAVSLQADLLDSANCADLIDRAAAAFGGLDVLINNASSFYPTPLGRITDETWNDLVGSNLKAPLFLSQAAAVHLRQRGGQIINMVDIHARRPLADHPVYCAAKAGLAMLTRSLARDLAPEVRVNGIAPGAILWPEEGMDAAAKKETLRQVPLARCGAPEDIARCVLYLIRDADYVTGQIIAIDGGRSLGW